jgi:far upstream element-binding protein
MVPDRTVGLIIGRRGETIKDLQERSGCHVNIEDKNLNGLRPVNLTGPPRATEKAKGLIMDIVESDSNQHSNPPPREMRGHGPSDAGDKLTDSFFIPKDAVGMIIGKRE